MAASIYDDKLITPTNKMLEVDLLTTKNYLNEISNFIESNYGEVRPEWKFYNKKFRNNFFITNRLLSFVP